MSAKGFRGFEACDQGNYPTIGVLLFPEKEAKSVSSASQKSIRYRGRDPGVSDIFHKYSLPCPLIFIVFQNPQRTTATIALLFLEGSKKALAWRSHVRPIIREADPGGLGACPQRTTATTALKRH
jgi:hypothetical protein